jgi:hypothetical protein
MEKLDGDAREPTTPCVVNVQSPRLPTQRQASIKQLAAFFSLLVECLIAFGDTYFGVLWLQVVISAQLGTGATNRLPTRAFGKK